MVTLRRDKRRKFEAVAHEQLVAVHLIAPPLAGVGHCDSDIRRDEENVACTDVAARGYETKTALARYDSEFCSDAVLRE
jgi:hypothetical protein